MMSETFTEPGLQDCFFVKILFAEKNIIFGLPLKQKESIFAPLLRDFPIKVKAEVAQLVEHHLAKVRVASSSLVFCSKSPGNGAFLFFSTPLFSLGFASEITFTFCGYLYGYHT